FTPDQNLSGNLGVKVIFSIQFGKLPQTLAIICALPVLVGASVWAPFLTELNREPQYTANRPSAASVEVAADIMKIFEQENRAISEKVSAQMDAKLKGSAKKRRTNELYFDAVNALNR